MYMPLSPDIPSLYLTTWLIHTWNMSLSLSLSFMYDMTLCDIRCAFKESYIVRLKTYRVCLEIAHVYVSISWLSTSFSHNMAHFHMKHVSSSHNMAHFHMKHVSFSHNMAHFHMKHVSFSHNMAHFHMKHVSFSLSPSHVWHTLFVTHISVSPSLFPVWHASMSQVLFF